MKSIIVTYLCVRVLAAVPCATPPPCDTSCIKTTPDGEWNLGYDLSRPECKGCVETSNQSCHDEPIVEHELRSRLEEPFTAPYCKPYNVLNISPECRRQPYTDGEWHCEPFKEIAP